MGLRARVPFTSWFVTSGSTRSCCGCFLLNHKKKEKHQTEINAKIHCLSAIVFSLSEKIDLRQG